MAKSRLIVPALLFSAAVMLAACGNSPSNGNQGGKDGGGHGGSSTPGGTGGIAGGDGTRDAGQPDVAVGADTGTVRDASSPDSLDGGEGGGGGGLPQQCLMSFANPFAALTPYWANWSNSTCGSAVASNGNLVLTQNEPCGTASPDVIEGLTQPYVLCGDFDVQVGYALTGFGTAPVGGMFASLRVDDPAAPLTGMTMERYVASYPPSSNSYQNYKSYTDNSGNDATSVILATSDTTGRLRITRTGTTVTSYYWKVGATDAGTGQWVLVKTATLTSTPWVVLLYAGDNSTVGAGPAANYSVTFSNLQVTSPGATDAGTGIGPLADSGASDARDTAIAADAAGGSDTPLADSGATGARDTAIAADAGVPSSASLFMTDDGANTLQRYTITPNADPVLSASITLSGAVDVALRTATGELFVGDFTGGIVHRLLDPFGALVPNGTITGLPAGSYLEGARFVDDELWIADPGTSNIVRLAFDAQGNAAVAGTLPVSSNVRGLHWNAPTRDLYVTECCGTDTIRHYRVANDHSTTALTSVTGGGLNNPHDMLITPWGEFFVGNAGGNSVLRFSLDAQGNPTANGTITGNGMSGSACLAWAPWGELYVANQVGGSVSRFTFDSTHAAIPHGTFTFPMAQRLDWFGIFSGVPNGSSSDGGVTDAAGSDGGRS